MSDLVHLCERIRQRDQAAESELYELLKAAFCKYFLAKRPSDADDLLQETAHKTLLAIQTDSLEHPDHVLAYAWCAARTAVMSAFRYDSAGMRAKSKTVSIEVASRARAPQPDQFDQLVEKERFTEVFRRMQRLSLRDREVVRRFYFEGQTDEEIVRALQLNPNTIKTIRRRALLQLQQSHPEAMAA